MKLCMCNAWAWPLCVAGDACPFERARFVVKMGAGSNLGIVSLLGCLVDITL